MDPDKGQARRSVPRGLHFFLSDATGARRRVAQGSQRPVLPSQVPQYFLPSGSKRAPLVYRPMLLGISQVRFSDVKKKVDVTKELDFLAPITDDPVPVDWEAAKKYRSGNARFVEPA